MLEARFHDSLDEIDAATWNDLAASDNPFVSYVFLHGLERFKCIRPEWGWKPHHLGLYQDERLVAAAPLYLKGNSRGEFVFDWNWAHAWENAGGRYYPKLLNGSPWSPVTGPRLLVGHGEQGHYLRRQLVEAMQSECTRLGLSSVHANFLEADDKAAFDPAWLGRFDLQFHWHNHGYRHFEEFLAKLRHKKRKNIRHERAQAAGSGLEYAMHDGIGLSDEDWQTVYGLYCLTFAEKGNVAVLSLDFLRYLATAPGVQIQVALARRKQEIIAMALFLQSADTLYGRYWGCREHVPGLHFELCYYLGIEHCIDRGLTHFEPGAQGEHKMARGFLPQRTYSRHFFVHDGFRTAVAAALTHEADAMASYEADLRVRSPYADTDAASTESAENFK